MRAHVSIAEKLSKGLGRRSILFPNSLGQLISALQRIREPDELRSWRAGQRPMATKAARALTGLLDHVRAKSSLPLQMDTDVELSLFALHCYYAWCVVEVSSLLAPNAFPSLKACESPDYWQFRSCAEQLAVENLKAEIRESVRNALSSDRAQACSYRGEDLFQPLYHDLVPADVRHAYGEFYTPSWLVEHVLNVIEFQSGSAVRLLDPSCGSGAFLMAAIRRCRQTWSSTARASTDPAGTAQLLAHITSSISGLDLNPLAILAAKANYAIAIDDLVPANCLIDFPVYLADALLDSRPIGQFSHVAGNPPWIAWDNLSASYRDATKPLWIKYGLFSLAGNEARYGGGKKDLSSLMFYAAADRYLQDGGAIGFVVTQTLLQSKGAGDGFRRLRIGETGPHLGIYRVDDLVRTKPFAGVSNWTSVIAARKGSPTHYPVPYFVWPRRSELRKHLELNCALTDVCREKWASPIDPERPSSPWVLHSVESSDTLMQRAVGARHRTSVYSAHLGANTGGANAVYWVELVALRDGLAVIRNHTAGAKKEVPVLEAAIEPGLLYPLARWGDIRRFGCRSSLFLVLAQDPQTRTGIAESRMVKEFPRTLSFLQNFEEQLRQRAAYRRFQSRAPFYAMYNVGSYSVASTKVIWRRMDHGMNAVAVKEVDTAIGKRPVIPQETCVLVATSSFDEALYLAAVLNSKSANDLVQSHSVVGGKGFGTPSILDYLPLEQFDSAIESHCELAKLARAAQAPETSIECMTAWQSQMDDLVVQLWRS